MTESPLSEEHLLRAHAQESWSLPARERRVEHVFCILFAVAAGALVVLAPAAGAPSPSALAALLVAYAIAARVPIWCGQGSTVPTQLVLVPALFALPPATVPPLVALALVCGALLDVARSRQPPLRIASAIADAWPSLALAVVFVLAGAPAAELEAAPVLAIALGTQSATGVALSLLRARLGRAVLARSLVPLLLMVAAGDLALAPVAFGAAVATHGSAAAVLLLAPAIAFLAALTRERNARVGEATERVDELRRERRRVASASRRLGRAFGATVSREALVELVEASAADALDCAAGDALLELSPRAGDPRRQSRRTDDLHDAGLLRRALAGARPTGGCAALRDGELYALAHMLPSLAGEPVGALAVMRRGRRFTGPERELLALLASQAAAGLESVSLHELVRRQATTDELTGLANLRAFRDRLASEIERARRHDLDLSLLLLDLDHFKHVNDAYGHLEGDRVLGAIATALTRSARAGDLAARYGGEEMALLMPGSDAEGARVAAERLRAAVESLRVTVSDGDQVAITASVGAATTSGLSASARDLIASADAALYDAKRAGRNCVRVATAHPLARLLDH